MPILDPYGQPVSSGRFLDAAHNGGNRPAQPTRVEGIRKAVNTFDWRTVVSASRRLYANMGIAKGAIGQKAKFSIGRAWQPIFQGADKEWGDLATEWLVNEWYPSCEVRGGAFDFVTSLFVDSIAVDRDGGYGILLTEDESGFPQTQRIPIHRFGSRWESRETIVMEGDFKGMPIHQGIIYNLRGTPIAYRIYEDPVNNEVAEGAYKDVPASSLIHVYDPEWHDQGHGFPVFTHAVNEFQDMMQSQKWEQLNMLASSAQNIIEYNETGDDSSNMQKQLLGGDQTAAGLKTEVLEGGMIRYFKANSGSKLESFVNLRPGNDWEVFNDRLTRVALVGADWPLSMVWKAEGGGTDTRADIAKARLTVEDRQELLRPVARRLVGYALSRAVTPTSEGGLGVLPPYKGSDKGGFLRWTFSLPPKLGIDDGRDGNQRIDNLNAGVTTLEADQADRGGNWLVTREQKQREVVDLVRRAKDISAAEGIPFETALVLMQQSTPNATAPGVQPGAQPQEGQQ